MSGVRSSWDMLARNSDLWWLAASSCRPLSAISRKSRAFWIASAGSRGEGLQDLDELRRERTGRPPIDHQRPDDVILPDEGHRQNGPVSSAQEHVAELALVGALEGNVRHLDRLALLGGAAHETLPQVERGSLGGLQHGRIVVVRGPEPELSGRLVVLEDRARVGPRQLARARHDRVPARSRRSRSR